VNVAAVPAQLTGLLTDVIDHATGRHERVNPVTPRSGGPAGNALLTAWTGLVLLGLIVAELLTLIDVRGLISWHIAIGALLIPPALVKTGTTTWRMVHYYCGHTGYRIGGPPPTLLRLLGPLVVISTIGLLGSGVLLTLMGSTESHNVLLTALGLRIDWVTVHQGAFVAWAIATGLHLLARIIPALRLTGRQLSTHPKVPGLVGRAVVISTAMGIAVLLAILLVRADTPWLVPVRRFGR